MGWEDAPEVESKPRWIDAPIVDEAPIEGESPTPTQGGRASAGVAGLNTGIARLFGLPVDTAENIYNLVKAGGGAALGAIKGQPASELPELVSGTPGGSQSIISLLNKLGINTENPQPEDRTSRMLHTGGVIGGGSLVPGASVKGTLAAATGGAAAGEALGPEYTGLGALAPAAGGMALTNLKNSIAARSAPTVEAFRQAGTTPSVGQATDIQFLHGMENLAAKFPGGAGTMKAFIENQQKQMGAKARTGVSAEAAGRAIESGIRGEGGFLERTNSVWRGLEKQMADKISGNAPTVPTATANILDELTNPLSSAEKATVNPKLAAIRDGLAKDISAGNGEIPFQTLRGLRSRVGMMLDESLVSGIPNAELKRVYGALSQDIETIAKRAGAGPEFKRQNDYYGARMDRIETTLERVLGKNRQPEDVFKAINPTDPDQSNKLRQTLRSLTSDQRQVVSEAVANRLGRASPTNQNEAGDVFSSEKFLTNWNRLSPGAKQQLFPDPPLRENIEKIAKASASIREGKGIYSNPSGTAGSFAAYAVYTSPFVLLGQILGGTGGGLAVAGSAAGAVGGAYIGSKMLTNPKVVEWLATPVKPGTSQEAAHLARLGVIYNQSTPDVKEDLAKFVNSIKPAKPNGNGMNGVRG